MKYVYLFLVSTFVVVALGRFHTEADVRHKQRELNNIAQARESVERELEKVRLEVEVLESTRRLRSLNAEHLALGVVRQGQLIDEEGFAAIIGRSVERRESPLPANADVIGNVIGMSDLGIAERVVSE